MYGTLASSTFNHVANRNYYLRSWVYCDNQATDLTVGYSSVAGTNGFILARYGYISSQYKWEVGWANASGAIYFYSNPMSHPLDEWMRVEMRVYVGSTSGQCQVELRINGTSVISQTGITRQTSWTGLQDCLGVVNLGSATFLDSMVENDDQGSFQNTWPGDSTLVLLRPKADVQVGSWTGGGGGTSGIYTGVDNRPPTGSVSPSNANSIHSQDSSGDNGTDEYRATLQSPSDLGVTSGNNLTMIQPIAWHGEEVASGTKTGSISLLSNPTQGGYTGFTFGEDLGIQGTWPIDWGLFCGTPIDVSAQAYTAEPQIAVRKTDAGSAYGSLCALGAYLEYIVASVPDAPVLSSAIPGNQMVDLVWTTPDNNGNALTKYEVWRSESTGNEIWVADVEVVNTWRDTGRTNGTQYFYKVLATSSAGDSSLSNELSATPSLFGTEIMFIGSYL